PRRYIGASVTEDGRFLVISAANSTSGNELYIRDVSKPDSPIGPVVDHMDDEQRCIAMIGDAPYTLAIRDAPNTRVVTADAADPGPENWTDLIPETEHVLSASTGGGKIFAHYLKDAVSFVQQYSMDGELEQTIDLPGVGTARGFSAKREETELYYMFTSYTYPTTIFRYDISSGKSEVYRESGADFDPDQYESKQVFYTSKDSTRIPMIITHKKGVELTGDNPALLYGYGGFNISITPSFSVHHILLLENGGIYAVPNLRGGGEYGEEWHEAGTRMNKQNVFDDFIAAAEYLIDHDYTSPELLGISGRSNGGLLVGAVMTQRPDLFQVAFPAVGVLDMLRYHEFTAGA